MMKVPPSARRSTAIESSPGMSSDPSVKHFRTRITKSAKYAFWSLALLGAFVSSPAAQLQDVYSFAPGASVYPNGLLLLANGAFYGSASSGGAGNGNIFRLAANGTFTELAILGGVYGRNPQGVLVQGNDGALYGTTEFGGGGGYDAGTVFRVTTNGSLSVVATFGI